MSNAGGGDPEPPPPPAPPPGPGSPPGSPPRVDGGSGLWRMCSYTPEIVGRYSRTWICVYVRQSCMYDLGRKKNHF